MSINCAKNIIKKIHITVLVNRSRKLNPLLLASTHVDASLTNLCLVTELHLGQVCLKCAPVENVFVLSTVHRASKQNVILNGSILDPRRLSNISRGPPYLNL